MIRAEHGGIASLSHTGVVRALMILLVDSARHAATLEGSLICSKMSMLRIFLEGRCGRGMVTNRVAANELAELRGRVLLFAQLTDQLSLLILLLDGSGTSTRSLATIVDRILLG